jgi:hypothetical protein
MSVSDDVLKAAEEIAVKAHKAPEGYDDSTLEATQYFKLG